MSDIVDEIKNTRDQQPRTKEAATMSDDTERSVASAGSVVAYDIQWGGRRHLSWERPSEHWKPQPESIIPLYAHQTPALTAEEREAIHYVVGDVADITGPVEDILRGLLERTK